jgi:hypothetical protein
MTEESESEEKEFVSEEIKDEVHELQDAEQEEVEEVEEEESINGKMK